MVEMITKQDMLKKLKTFKETPDNDTIRFKKKIEKKLIGCPELLYALNEKKFECELFDDKGNINWDTETGEPLGEWDKYFANTSRDSNIRPYLFIPDTQTEVKHYICYQVNFTESPRYNSIEKYIQVKFTVFVHGNDRMDKLTGIPRHDLLAAIIQEQINWTNIFGTQCMIVSDQESTTDNNYLVRTFIFQATMPNAITQTKNGSSMLINKIGR